MGTVYKPFFSRRNSGAIFTGKKTSSPVAHMKRIKIPRGTRPKLHQIKPHYQILFVKCFNGFISKIYVRIVKVLSHKHTSSFRGCTLHIYREYSVSGYTIHTLVHITYSRHETFISSTYLYTRRFFPFCFSLLFPRFSYKLPTASRRFSINGASETTTNIQGLAACL